MRTISILLLALLAYSCHRKPELKASIKLVRGEVSIRSAEGTKPASSGDTFRVQDTILTGKNGIAIITLGGDAEIELQPEAEFSVKEYSETVKDLYLASGNTWLKVFPEAHVKGFKIRTPTLAAGVRGTKFYLHKLGDMSAICHCEGEVDVSTNDHSYSATHHQDSLSFTRGGRTIILEPEEVKSVFGNIEHRHSLLEDSPLGPPQPKLTAAQIQKLKDLVEKKFSSK